MNTEANRIKVAKYRARRSLREMGYTEDEIATLITFTNWMSTTPAQFLANLAQGSPPPARVAARARQPRETPEATTPASVPQETRRARAEPPEDTEQEPDEEEYTGSSWSILSVALFGLAIMGIVAQAINKNRPQ